ATRAADGRFAEILDLAGADSKKLRDVLARHDGDESRLFSRVRSQLEVPPDETDSRIVVRFCDGLRPERAHREHGANWLSNGLSSDTLPGRRLRVFLEADMAPDAVEELRATFTTQNGARQSLATKGLIRAEPKLYEYISGLQQRFLVMEDA